MDLAPYIYVNLNGVIKNTGQLRIGDGLHRRATVSSMD